MVLGAHMISIIIPTYNEKENIKRIVPRIFSALDKAKIKGEVIVVDDNSPDGTAEEAEALGKRYPVRVLKRPGKLGLSSAVLDGFKLAKGEMLGVMDADLSHPPKKIPEMIKRLESGSCEFVLGSRHVKGGKIENWPLKRKIISMGAKILSRPLTNVKDPMSGFFFLRRDVLERGRLNPKGFKIALEIVVKCKPRVVEVPITFTDRAAGKSKMGRSEIVNYLIHIAKLYSYRIRE